MPGLDPLTDRFRTYYWAQRGSGQSTRPFDRFDSKNTREIMQTVEAKLGLGAQIADIERIRRILGHERLVLVGHSFGGFIAAMYAVEFPEHVEAWILVAPADVSVMPSPTGGLFELLRERLPEDERAGFDSFVERYLDFGSLAAKSEQDLVEQQRAFGRYYALATGGDPDRSEEDVAGAGGWVVPACFMSLGCRHDWRPELGEVTVPALVVHGTHDLQPEARSRVYADVLPNAELVHIDGAGHFPHRSQPAQFAELVSDFLGRR